MIKLMRLELKRNNVRQYLLASAVICLVLIGFTYLVAFASQLEDTNASQREFRNYSNIFRLICIISLTAFSAMSSIMYSRLVIAEYTGKRAALLFSYPVSRSRILLAKILLVFLFTSAAMLICTAIPYILFSATESTSQIITQDVITRDLVADTLKTALIAVLALGGIGIVALRIGFINKSVPTTLISALLLSAVYGNAAITTSNGVISLLVSGFGLVAAAALMAELSARINKMEVE